MSGFHHKAGPFFNLKQSRLAAENGSRQIFLSGFQTNGNLANILGCPKTLEVQFWTLTLLIVELNSHFLQIYL